MSKLADKLRASWDSRLFNDYPQETIKYRQSIVGWLLGENLERFNRLTPNELAIAYQSIEYRYRILQQRYLGLSSTEIYSHLLNRLGAVMVRRNSIRLWISQSINHQKIMMEMLQAAIQDILQNNPHIQQQITWIGKCTQFPSLREALLFTTLEEYCLQSLRNQPLFTHHLANFLIRQWQENKLNRLQREILALVSKDISLDLVSSSNNWEEQQLKRVAVQQLFESYLKEKIGQLGVQWLRLYLQCRSQDAIAKSLDLPIQQVSRLKEKVTYQAIQIFVLQNKLESVA